MAENNDLKSRHKVSIDGIFFNGYTIKKLLNSSVFWGSLGLAILLGIGMLTCINEANDVYGCLDDLASIVLAAFPSLLGFSIAGYALIIGASDVKLIGRMSDPLQSNEKKLSFFQILSCIFASSVLIQCVSLIMAFCIHIIVKQRWIIDNEALCYGINLIVYVGLLFMVLLSMLLLCSTVVNLFTYGQSVHFCVRLDKEAQEMNKEDGLWKELKDAVIGVLIKYLKKDE